MAQNIHTGKPDLDPCRRTGPEAHKAAGAGAGWPLRQRQDHPCRPADPAVPGQHRPAHGRFLSAARPARPRLGKTPCANMDLDRLRDEALRPAYEGQPVLYRAYSCRAGAYQPVQELAAQPLVILEGSYSHHPLLAGYETLRVFVTCSKEEQTRRLQAREGERYANFAARWIPLEEGYFAQYRIEETADLAVDTTAANACTGMMCR